MADKAGYIYMPDPLGVGTKIGKSRKVSDGPYPFGFRPLPSKVVSELSGGGFSPDIVGEIMKKNPKPIDQIKTLGIVQGPINFSREALDFISERHKKLNNKRRMELDRLLGRSGVMSAYG